MRRLLHFGPGNFFRAHLAEYLFDAGGWDIVAVPLRSRVGTDTTSYSLAVQSVGVKKISVISEITPAALNPARVLEHLGDPSVEVVSATVTEKGYHLGKDGLLDLQAPEVLAEIAANAPRSLIGFLVHGLAERTAPVTVLSCDNLSDNGTKLERAVRAFADAAGLKIACKVSFPNTMVDRITPATTDALRTETGDPTSVPCEPFKEWVVEDRFATLRPDWPGVQWVQDVAPHEMRKLRMLNGAHSYLAYAGVLAGHEFVHQAVADPELRRAVQALMAEAAETLSEATRGQAKDYANALVTRFENPNLNHALRQIAMDGSQKLPQRIVETLRARGLVASPALTAALQAWIGFCRAETAAGRALEDPQADLLAKAQSDAEFLKLIGADDLAMLTEE